MSKTGRYNYRRPEKGRNSPTRPERHITVRSVRRDPPDLRKLSRAIIAMALVDAEREKSEAEETAEAAAAQEDTANQKPSQDADHDA
ncbi:hypothetical protein ACIBCN_19895 [Nocardia sp. NPDC051052]|uniref:hypothetical protein n=1 Tax=Nocardia sp. NPDC051052 TaxID=3364322 RepID=UPI0037992B9C